MKKEKWNLFQRLGLLLILMGAGLLVFSGLRGWRTGAVTEQIESRLPDRITGYSGIYADPAMPVLQIQGRDFCGLIDFPAYGRKLPVSGSWEPGKLSVCPSRFWGSAYDGSLVIGGSELKGQFDFFDRIDMGDMITVTDMTGAEFDYQVVWVERSSEADPQWLLSPEYDLTLFAREAFSLNYISVRCILS